MAFDRAQLGVADRNLLWPVVGDDDRPNILARSPQNPARRGGIGVVVQVMPLISVASAALQRFRFVLAQRFLPPAGQPVPEPGDTPPQPGGSGLALRLAPLALIVRQFLPVLAMTRNVAGRASP